MEDPIQPALTSRDLKGGVRNQRESAQSGQEREKELFVLSVVGNIEECRIGQPTPAWIRRRAAIYRSPPVRGAQSASKLRLPASSQLCGLPAYASGAGFLLPCVAAAGQWRPSGPRFAWLRPVTAQFLGQSLREMEPER